MQSQTWILPLVVVVALAGSGGPARTSSSQAQTTPRCFEEAGYCIEGRIRDYWETNGGLPVFGYPISEQHAETIEGTTVQVQWFERNRLELHPEHDPPYDVLLGRLGVDVLEQQGRDWQAFPRSEPQEGCRYFAETQQNVCGDVLAAWRANGLELGDPGISEAESLALFGLPISPLHEEAINGQSYQVQWFERARFELHPENDPPYTVLLGLLGQEMTSEHPAPTPEPTPEAPLACQGRLAFQMRRDDNLDIYTINADGTDLQRLTDDPASDKFPVWSPDGTRIAFVSRRTGIEKLYVMDADGSHQTRLTDDPDGEGDMAWSPDGKTIVFTGVQRTLWMMDADGSQKRQLAPSPTYSLDPVWSPDGTQIAFWAITEGTAAIYLINADGTGLRSLGAGESPVWSPDGTHLAFERDTSFNNSDIFLP